MADSSTRQNSGNAGGRRMLIVRFSAMGDVIMSLFAVSALRKTYPDLRITVATKPKFAKFYREIPDIGILELDANGSLKSLFRIISAAAKSGVDYVADIHNSLRSRIIRYCLFFTGARIALFRKNRRKRSSIKGKGLDIVPFRHNVLKFCDVFARLGFPVPVPEQKRQKRPIPEVFGSKSGRWIGYAPFASKSMKIYPRKQSLELIRLMSESYDRVFLFSGPGKELEFVREMELKHANVTGVFGKTDIWGELALMTNIDAMVTMDSSSMHLASLAAVPLVSVWGATHPAAGFMGYGYDIDRNCIQADLPCRPCSIYGEGKCRYDSPRCFETITPEMIMEKVAAVSRA